MDIAIPRTVRRLQSRELYWRVLRRHFDEHHGETTIIIFFGEIFILWIYRPIYRLTGEYGMRQAALPWRGLNLDKTEAGAGSTHTLQRRAVLRDASFDNIFQKSNVGRLYYARLLYVYGMWDIIIGTTAEFIRGGVYHIYICVYIWYKRYEKYSFCVVFIFLRCFVPLALWSIGR
jgi:hypothetical protein